MSQSGFLSRWSQRKQQHQSAQAEKEAPDTQTQDVSTTLPASAETSALAAPMPSPDIANADNPSAQAVSEQVSDTDSKTPLGDADMPDLASIDGNTNVSAFFSEGVSQALRKQALKAMFLKPEFNIRDGLDDYDLDYASAPELTAEVAGKLRQWMKEKTPDATEAGPETDAGSEVDAVATEADAAAAGTANETSTESSEEKNPDQNGDDVHGKAADNTGNVAGAEATTESQNAAPDSTAPSESVSGSSGSPVADQNLTDLASGKERETDSSL